MFCLIPLMPFHTLSVISPPVFPTTTHTHDHHIYTKTLISIHYTLTHPNNPQHPPPSTSILFLSIFYLLPSPSFSISFVIFPFLLPDILLFLPYPFYLPSIFLSPYLLPFPSSSFISCSPTSSLRTLSIFIRLLSIYFLYSFSFPAIFLRLSDSTCSLSLFISFSHFYFLLYVSTFYLRASLSLSISFIPSISCYIPSSGCSPSFFISSILFHFLLYPSLSPNLRHPYPLLPAVSLSSPARPGYKWTHLSNYWARGYQVIVGFMRWHQKKERLSEYLM